MEGFKKMLEKKMEKLSDIREVDMDEASKEILKTIAEEQKNPEGKRYIFAPNHLKPASEMRAQLVLADDFPFFNKMLKEAGIENNRPVARGDTDMSTDNLVSRTIYQLHRKTFTKMGESLIDSLPVDINRNEPILAQQQNVANVRAMLREINGRENNITIYPYGNWYPSGTQDFSEDVAFPKVDKPERVDGGNEPHTEKDDPEFAKQVAEGEVGFDEWRNSVKRGAFAMARLSGAAVVPVYIEHEGESGRWSMRVGEPIEASEDDAMSTRELDEEMARRYVHTMGALKAAVHKNKEGPEEGRGPLQEAA